MQDYTGMFEKVARKGPIYDIWLRNVYNTARTSPGKNAPNVAHWKKRQDQMARAIGNRFHKMPLEEKIKHNEMYAKNQLDDFYATVMRGYNDNKVMPRNELQNAKDIQTELYQKSKEALNNI